MPGQTRRRYTKAEKAAAIVAATAASTVAASEQTGIPRTTIQYWLDQPEFVALRQNAREAIAEEAQVVARLAWAALATAIRSGQLDGRDLVMAAGMATDKAQLLNGGATARTESRDITGTLSDADLVAALREADALAGGSGAPAAAADAPAGD